MPILKGAASDFTTYKKVNAQSLTTTGVKPTASTAVPVVSVVASVVKATTVAAKSDGKNTVLTTSTLKGNTSKRG